MLDWVELSNPVAIWWIFLIAASLVNVVAWFYVRRFVDQGGSIDSVFHRRLRPQAILWFSAAYVFGCAFRSFFPRADVQKIVLFDSWISSIFVGRSVATIAELSFVAQWAIVLRVLARVSQSEGAEFISFLIVPLIAFAEVCSWSAVITTNYLGNAIEESTWGIVSLLIVVALAMLWPRFKGSLQSVIGAGIAGGALYVAFMFAVDVPMYLSRWRADLIMGKELLSFTDGFRALVTQWRVTHAFIEWRDEIPWMSLYFSIAVLVSVGLCLIPLSKERLRKYLRS